MIDKSGAITHTAGWNLDNSYTRLPDSFFTRINPEPVSDPQLAILNKPLASVMGLHVDLLSGMDGANIFAGNLLPKGSDPIAQAYAGHQFGHFTMLGDGRAILLGEQITPSGERFDIQLKGSGRTPYSRGGDGRAALGPMLREYIISEAISALGIPTTRSLAVVTTGQPVVRETLLPGAVLTRTAASHIRVGTFQYTAKWCTREELKALADYTLKRHYTEEIHSENPYLSLLRGVIRRQAELICQWQLAGFIHGVMNTDNMTISGETIDYGPCAFMDTYDPETVFSSIDRHGRYAYGNQPNIGAWNLTRFAETLLPFLHENEEQAIKLAQDELSRYGILFHSKWLYGMSAKLGIFHCENQDDALINELLDLMYKYKADYTNTFLSITFGDQNGQELFEKIEFLKWYDKWQERLERQAESMEDSKELMRNNNPAVIPRNHRVEAALDAAVNHNDLSVMEKLLEILSEPFKHTPEQKDFSATPPPSTCKYRTFCGT